MMRRLARADGGTGLVEFALVAPVMMFLLIGLIEVGRFTYFGILAAHAAEAGVQYGAQTTLTALDTTGVTNAAAGDAQNLPNWHVTRTIVCSINGQVSVCPANNTNSVSPNLVYYVQVQVTATFNSLLNYPGIANSIPVSATAQMRVATQ
jgi:Flp pilus assembly protein TadG